MSVLPPGRPALRLVRGDSQPAVEHEHAWFCGYCAAPCPGGTPTSPHARVCSGCGLGLMLEARSDVLPAPQDAFLVIDSRLLVQGISREAEAILGVTEHDGVDRPVTELLVGADAEASDADSLSALILAAVARDDCVETVVRPLATFGVRLRARIGACGPPRAALVVLPDDRPRSLRLV